MGVGRRMKKQGPPEPLSEAHFAKLKRKAGLPVDPVAAKAPEKKKRKVEPTKQNGSGPRKGAPAKGGRESKAKTQSVPKPKANGKGGKSKAAPALEELSDGSELELDDDEFDGLEDGGSDEVSDDEEGGAPLKDDFLDSDPSVYDSEEDQHRQAMFSEDEDDSEAEERLTAANIEGLSKKLDQQMEEEAADAEAEMQEGLQTNISGDAQVLEDDEDDEAAKKNQLLAPDLQVLRSRITENIRILDDFAKLAEKGRSRQEYRAQLMKDVCSYYGYSEFMAEKFLNLFTAREAFAFFEANETARPVVIRTNTLRTHRRDLAQALINRGVTLEPVGKWSKVGLQVFESSVPLGATPEYLAGHYILQAATSFLPCMALDPQENERVLDMAAAPGGKTTYLAAMMKNTGFVMANDPNRARAKGLVANIHRLGCRNVIVSNHDAREFPKPMGGFDRVLLDAPCTGTGVISKDPSVKTNRTELDFVRLPHTQKQLILAAIDSVNHKSPTGGFVVYSTCSVAVEENEQVVQYALSRRPNIRIVDSGVSFGKEGFVSYMGKKFDPSMKLARRYYPHTYNVDGFFLCKLQKTGPTPARAVGASASGSASGQGVDDGVDKTPVVETNGAAGSGDDDFGGFDEEEDAKYIEKARRNAMRRRGMDPHAVNGKKGKAGKEKSKN